MSNRKKDIEIYSEEQFKKDKKNFEDAEKGNSQIDWSSFKRLLTRDLLLNNVYDKGLIDNIKLSDYSK